MKARSNSHGKGRVLRELFLSVQPDITEMGWSIYGLTYYKTTWVVARCGSPEVLLRLETCGHHGAFQKRNFWRQVSNIPWILVESFSPSGCMCTAWPVPWFPARLGHSQSRFMGLWKTVKSVTFSAHSHDMTGSGTGDGWGQIPVWVMEWPLFRECCVKPNPTPRKIYQACFIPCFIILCHHHSH